MYTIKNLRNAQQTYMYMYITNLQNHYCLFVTKFGEPHIHSLFTLRLSVITLARIKLERNSLYIVKINMLL